LENKSESQGIFVARALVMQKVSDLTDRNKDARDSWADMVTNTIIVLATFLAIYFMPTAADRLFHGIEKIPPFDSSHFAAQY
jgi:hypothetical protein